MDRMMQQVTKRYGFYTALRYVRNLGISFEDCYFMCFGRMPK